MKAGDQKWQDTSCKSSTAGLVCKIHKLYPSSSPDDHHSNGHLAKAIGTSLGVIVGIALVAGLIIFIARKRPSLRIPSMPAFENPLRSNRTRLDSRRSEISPDGFSDVPFNAQYQVPRK